MSTVVGAAKRQVDQHQSDAHKRRSYGHFVANGGEYVITDPRTPRPWTNVIANERMGLAVSQTGSGFSWIDNSQLAAITRWQQDMTEDSSGKFLYLRDIESGELWSLTPAPTWRKPDHYACRHGLGFSTFEHELAGIRSDWTLFVHAEQPVEFWRVALTNNSDRVRRLELVAYLEWNCGTSPSPRREFTKLFVANRYDAARGAIYANGRMWDVPNKEHGHWNTDFPYISALASSRPVAAAEGDKLAFLGRYGSLRRPEALEQAEWAGSFGSHYDAIAAMRVPLEIEPGETLRSDFVLAVGEQQALVDQAFDTHLNEDAVDTALEQVQAAWKQRFAAHRIKTPDQTVNDVINDWVRYQAISGRLWGRCGYYQQSGAFGFRDQLQDSQVWLTIDPASCRQQINLHAQHQFVDGSVYHWWHPLSEQGLVTTMTDDLLWLAFTTANYLKETGDLSVLDDQQPFLDDEQPASITEHVRRAFARVFKRTSPRGLPYIGAGDWNDGLSAAGVREKGESIWLGHFLAGLLAEWSEIYTQIGKTAEAEDFQQRRAALVKAINEHGWDGAWYIRATLDDGSKLGSNASQWGKIFLNAQTWAILNDVAPPERAKQCYGETRQRLFDEIGALLLAPAFDTPTPQIGYITRYAPGLRENGGVYTHAATWAIAAAAKMKDHQSVGHLLNAINPANKDPERYWAEPYVTPGNVDGPDSPLHGRAGWTWYTGSAAWLHRVFSEWVLGVRPDWAGLRIDPCLPVGWDQVSVTRPYRGVNYQIQMYRDDSLASGSAPVISVDGRRLEGNVITADQASAATVQVNVQLPPL